jgi:hypothetical protein
LFETARRVFYAAVYIVPSGEIVRVRDVVLVDAGVCATPWVARLLGLWEDKITQKRYMRTQWFSRVHELPAIVAKTMRSTKPDFNVTVPEVVRTFQWDDNDVSFLRGVARVFTTENELLKAHAAAMPRVFLCRFEFDAEKRELRRVTSSDMQHVLPQVLLDEIRTHPELLQGALTGEDALCDENKRHVAMSLIKCIGTRQAKGKKRTKAQSERPNKKQKKADPCEALHGPPTHQLLLLKTSGSTATNIIGMKHTAFLTQAA